MAVPTVITKNVAAQSITASTPFDLWTPASGKRIRILGFALSLTVAGSIVVKLKHSGSYSETLRTPLLLAGTGTTITLGSGIIPGVADDIIALDVSSSGSVSGFLFGTEESSS
jgi:hypothetical protein